MRHLAIFYPKVIEQIFNGKKTVESRFSKKKIAPFGKIKVGDIVFIKPSGKDIVGQFWVNKVISIEGMDSSDWQLLKKEYGDNLSLPENIGAKYGTLIFIGRVDQLITAPIKIEKHDKRGWVVLEK